MATTGTDTEETQPLPPPKIERPRRRFAPGRFPMVLAGILASLLIGELAIRVAAPHIQPPLVWSSWEAQNKVAAMDRLAKRGGASVVFFGTSQINADVDPVTFSAARNDPRPSFNAALNGSDSLLHAAWGLRVVVPRLKPSVVVLGLTSRDLNDNGQNKVFARFRNSKAGKQVLRRESLTDKADRIASKWSHLIKYRTVLRKPVTVVRGGDEQEKNAGVSEYGVLEALRIYDVDHYDTKGFVQRTRDTLVNFSVGGREEQALRRLVRGMEREGITVVLVDMPVTKDMVALHTRGQKDYDAYKAALRKVIEDEKPLAVDLTDDFTSTEEFADPGHLRPVGRTRLTAMLAEQIPPAPR